MKQLEERAAAAHAEMPAKHVCGDSTLSIRLSSCESPHASAWLFAVPSNDKLRMTDHSMRVAVRHMLNLPLGPMLPRYCPCCADIAENKAPVDLRHHSSHVLCCRRLIGHT